MFPQLLSLKSGIIIIHVSSHVSTCTVAAPVVHILTRLAKALYRSSIALHHDVMHLCTRRMMGALLLGPLNIFHHCAVTRNVDQIKPSAAHTDY